MQAYRASRQVQLDQAEVVEALGEILDLRVLESPQRAENAEGDVGVLVQDAELQASLAFVGDTPRLTWIVLPMASCRAFVFFSSNATTPRNGCFRSAQ